MSAAMMKFTNVVLLPFSLASFACPEVEALGTQSDSSDSDQEFSTVEFTEIFPKKEAEISKLITLNTLDVTNAAAEEYEKKQTATLLKQYDDQKKKEEALWQEIKKLAEELKKLKFFEWAERKLQNSSTVIENNEEELEWLLKQTCIENNEEDLKWLQKHLHKERKKARRKYERCMYARIESTRATKEIYRECNRKHEEIYKSPPGDFIKPSLLAYLVHKCTRRLTGFGMSINVQKFIKEETEKWKDSEEKDAHEDLFTFLKTSEESFKEDVMIRLVERYLYYPISMTPKEYMALILDKEFSKEATKFFYDAVQSNKRKNSEALRERFEIQKEKVVEARGWISWKNRRLRKVEAKKPRGERFRVKKRVTKRVWEKIKNVFW